MVSEFDTRHGVRNMTIESDRKRLMPAEMPIPTNVFELRKDLKVLIDPLNENLPCVGDVKQEVFIKELGDVHLTADIVAPVGEGPFPTMVFLHGGAWVAGSSKSHWKMIHTFAQHGFLVVSVDYRLAPEARYPSGLDDCVDGILWASENAHKFDGDTGRIVIAGDSAGANLAAAAIGRLNSLGHENMIRAMALMYGFYDYEKMFDDRQKTILETGDQGTDFITEAYFGTEYPAREVLRSLEVSPAKDVAGLPPVFLLCGSNDPFIEQNQLLADALARSGIKHEYLIADQMPHGYLQFNYDEDIARQSFARMSAFLWRNATSSK